MSVNDRNKGKTSAGDTKTVYRAYFLWDFEEEQCWLDRMAAEGWVLKEVGLLRYVFEPCVPGEWRVQFEMLEGWTKQKENREYIGFVESTGAEYIGSVKRWAYFRKRTAEGAFDIFSDVTSRLDHIGRILSLMTVLLLPLAFWLVYLLALTVYGFSVQFTFTDGVLIGLCASLMGAELIWMLRGWRKLRGLRKRLEKERLLHE